MTCQINLLNLACVATIIWRHKWVQKNKNILLAKSEFRKKGYTTS